MSTSPFVTVLRSLNYSHVVENFSNDVVDSLDNMKLPRIEIRMKAMIEAFDKQLDSAKKVNEYSKTDNVKVLSDKLKEINELCGSFYENRAFKEEEAKPQVNNEQKEETIETNQ